MMKKIITSISAATLAFSLSTAFACNDQQQALNKKVVKEFYQTALNEKNYPAAEKYLGATYKQHNPNATDGKEGLKNYIEYLRATYPKSHSEIKRIFVEGNYVIVQVHATREPGTKGLAIFDLFKLKDGKIVEHWDAVQDIPQQAKNNNTMF